MKRVVWVITAVVVLLAAACQKGSDGGDVPGLSTAFDIDVSDVTASCAAVSVRATSGSGLFYFDVIESEALTAFESPRELAEGWIENIFELIDEYNQYDEADYELMDFLSRGSDSYHYTCQLSPKTRYAVLAFEVDSEGRVGANISLAEFDTTEVEASKNTFEITVEGTLAKINASIKDEYYLFDIYRSEELEGLTEPQIISRLIYDAIDYGIGDFVMGCGFDELDYDEYLVNGLSYSAVCVGYDGGATTSLTRYDFTYKSNAADSDFASDIYQGESNLSANTDFRADRLEVVLYGDLYNTGAKVYKLSALTQSGDMGFAVEICTDADSESFAGTYHTAQPIGTPRSMLLGYQRDAQTLLGSWFWNNDLSERSAALDGVTTISLNGDNIVLNTEWSDSNSIKVFGSYSGKYTYSDKSDIGTPSAAMLAVTTLFDGTSRVETMDASRHRRVNGERPITKRAIKVSLA